MIFNAQNKGQQVQGHINDMTLNISYTILVGKPRLKEMPDEQPMTTI